MFQTTLTSTVLTLPPMNTPELTSTMQVDALIDDKQIIRIMQPKLLEEMWERFENGRSATPVLSFKGQLFISLQKIRNQDERERVFFLLRDYQLGQTINMALLPRSIHAALTGSKVAPVNLASALTIGLVAGIAFGIFMLVLTMMILTIGGRSIFTEMGLQISTAVFIFGTLTGCAASTFLFQRKNDN